EANGGGRPASMDTEGRAIDFIIPGPWAYGAPALAPHLTRGLYAAYHRYMAEYCSADPRRLKSMVLAPATDPSWAAQAITELAKDDWVAAVWPLLPEDLPVDDPELEPIWAAANDADLAVMYQRPIATSGTTRRWDAAPARRGAASVFCRSCSWAACSIGIRGCASAHSSAATAGCRTGCCA